MAFLLACCCRKLSVPASIGVSGRCLAIPPAAAAQPITHTAMTARIKCARRPEALAGTCVRCFALCRGGERPAVFTSLSGRFALSSKQPVLLRQPEQGSRPRFLPFLAAGIAGGSDFCSSRQSPRTLFGLLSQDPRPPCAHSRKSRCKWALPPKRRYPWVCQPPPDPHTTGTAFDWRCLWRSPF